MTRKVLVIDSEAGIRKALTSFLMGRGYEVLQASSREQGLDLFRQHRPSITFADPLLPGMEDLSFLREALRLDPHAHLILVTTLGHEALILEALRLGACNFFRKPLNYREISEGLNALETRLLAEQEARFDYGCVLEEGEVLEIPNDLGIVSAVVNHLTRTLPNYFDDQHVHGVQGALIEMIVNAIEHGNLEITYEEKTRALEQDQLNDLILSKTQQPELARRRVRISYAMHDGLVTYEIEDEGQGFDISGLPDPGDPENIWLGHGRGILMTRALMDEVTYNAKGNRVRLSKRLPRLEEEADQG